MSNKMVEIYLVTRSLGYIPLTFLHSPFGHIKCNLLPSSSFVNVSYLELRTLDFFQRLSKVCTSRNEFGSLGPKLALPTPTWRSLMKIVPVLKIWLLNRLQICLWPLEGSNNLEIIIQTRLVFSITNMNNVSLQGDLHVYIIFVRDRSDCRTLTCTNRSSLK